MSVTLVLADPNCVMGDGRGDSYPQWLSDAEKREIAGFEDAKARTQAIVSRLIVRFGLSQVGDKQPQEWHLRRTKWGKPVLTFGGDNYAERQRDSADAQLYFSVGHTRGLVVCAICRDYHVGVDVEREDRKVASQRLSRRFFTAAEATALEAIEDTEVRRRRFLAMWTTKEAASKARGGPLVPQLARLQTCFAPRGTLDEVSNSTATVTTRLKSQDSIGSSGRLALRAAPWCVGLSDRVPVESGLDQWLVNNYLLESSGHILAIALNAESFPDGAKLAPEVVTFAP